MPSISQQDYIVIAPKVGNTIDVDAYALGQLAKILEKKDTSILSVLIQKGANYEFYKILGYTDSSVGYMDHTSEEVKGIDIAYNSTQYEGLAAVQEAGEAQYPGDDFANLLPILEEASGLLVESNTTYNITDLEGYRISVTVTDGKLATVALSEETAPNGIKVPFEEIQKLIGLPITVEKQQG